VTLLLSLYIWSEARGEVRRKGQALSGFYRQICRTFFIQNRTALTNKETNGHKTKSKMQLHRQLTQSTVTALHISQLVMPGIAMASSWMLSRQQSPRQQSPSLPWQHCRSWRRTRNKQKSQSSLDTTQHNISVKLCNQDDRHTVNNSLTLATNKWSKMWQRYNMQSTETQRSVTDHFWQVYQWLWLCQVRLLSSVQQF